MGNQWSAIRWLPFLAPETIYLFCCPVPPTIIRFEIKLRPILEDPVQTPINPPDLPTRFICSSNVLYFSIGSPQRVVARWRPRRRNPRSKWSTHWPGVTCTKIGGTNCISTISHSTVDERRVLHHAVQDFCHHHYYQQLTYLAMCSGWKFVLSGHSLPSSLTPRNWIACSIFLRLEVYLPFFFPDIPDQLQRTGKTWTSCWAWSALPHLVAWSMVVRGWDLDLYWVKESRKSCTLITVSLFHLIFNIKIALCGFTWPGEFQGYFWEALGISLTSAQLPGERAWREATEYLLMALKQLKVVSRARSQLNLHPSPSPCAW